MSSIHSPTIFTPRWVTSGTTDDVKINDALIIWYSPTPGAKTESVLPGRFPGQSVLIKDGQGTAGTYNITFSASNCTIDNQSSYTGLSLNYGCVSLIWDGASNWIIA